MPPPPSPWLLVPLQRLLLLLLFLVFVVAAVGGQPTAVSPVGVNYGAGYARSPLPKDQAFALLASKGTSA